MNNVYSPGQLCLALQRTLDKHKKDLGKNDSKTKKVDWIKAEAFKTIHILEKSMIVFNKDNETLKVNPKELISVLNTAIDLILKALSEKKGK